MAEYFKKIVQGKYIMDFGGGTGADLAWLVENSRNVCFCEPSKGMRDIAIKLNNTNIKSDQIEFMNESTTDFRQWNSTTFSKKFDAILANFCVFNTIDDLALLFSKLSSVLSSQAHIIALLLDTTLAGISKRYLKNFTVSLLKNKYPVSVVHHLKSSHTVYLHTPAKIMQALPNDFICKKIEPLGKSGFMLVHLQKTK